MHLKEKNLLKKFAATLKKFSAHGAKKVKKVEYGMYFYSIHFVIFQHYDRALVYIEENSKLADVIFPVPPIVVSLKDYDSVATSAQKLPVQGYPLVCVSVSHYSQSYLKGSPKGHKTIVFF